MSLWDRRKVPGTFSICHMCAASLTRGSLYFVLKHDTGAKTKTKQKMQILSMAQHIVGSNSVLCTQ